jgi:hypothetical protein
MSFKQKYLKYKQKYLELKNNQIGGYNLSDQTKGYMLDYIISNTLTKRENNFYFKFNERKKSFDETFNFFLQDVNYNSIFSYLLQNYTNNKPYEQEFSKKPNGKELISKFSGMIPYHINIGALMFLSFIIELEIFTLFNSIIPCNTISNPTRNNLNTAFCHKVDLCTPTRIYKDNILTNIIPLFNTFTHNLDSIFINFMKNLITNISTHYRKTYDEILIKIVPVEDYRYKIDTFEFIFVDWKDRLEQFLPPLAIDINKTINTIIYSTINQIESKDLIYIAESTGFFSYMYLVNPNNPSSSYGSCITYSMFELYIMSRLHINGSNMILLIEKEHQQPHEYWKLTQKRTNIETLTHYATKFNFSSGDFSLRSMFRDKGLGELRFDQNKNKILKLFIYIIYDMYIKYIESYYGYTLEQKSKVKKIMYFIRKRINKIEEMLNSNDIIVNLNSDVKIKKYLVDLSNMYNSELVNLDLDEIFKNPNIKNILLSFGNEIYEVIYNAILKSNFELVFKIISILENINGLYNGKTIIDYILEQKIEEDNELILEIIKILLAKRCQVTIDILKNIGYKNIKLYGELKRLFRIPDLTYEMILTYIENFDDFDAFNDNYMLNEILFNKGLIHEINTRRNQYGQSLLYLVCRKRFVIILEKLLDVNEYTNELLIDVNVKNLRNESTPLHGLVWGEDKNQDKWAFFISTMINMLAKNGAKNIKNKNDELPIDNIRISNQKIIEKIIESLSKISS